jgi:ATP-binding cassette subfamily B protein
MQPLADVLALMQAPITADRPLPAGTRKPMRWTELRFDKVAFRHGEGGFAIEDTSFAIGRGSRTGIAGPTGAGKSTLLDLIIGLLEPDAGAITVDGRPLDQASRPSWMGQIAHVPQAIYLADDSIAANIAFGRAAEEIDRDRLAAAVTAAQLDAFVADLPDGLATRVGERGMMLSGGQRQRIGIARALYKPARLLVLDEATSALDEATEAAVMAAIGALGDRTLIVVAHRRSTLAGCDRIIHVEGGKVSVGDGPGEPVRPPAPSRRSIRSGQD